MANGSGRAAGDILNAAMPFLRRYGRALTGCTKVGDVMAVRALQRARTKISTISAKDIRILLFQALHVIWLEPHSTSFSMVAARSRIQMLTPGALETLLLRAIEEFSFAEIAKVLSLTEKAVSDLFEVAVQEIPYRRGKRVLILEDDALIAMDMANCISEMGCVVTGVARTAAQAVDIATTFPPELVIANEILADQSSGRIAADVIARSRPGIDVVFLSAKPEELLAGDKNEPAFVIAKPYMEDQVRTAVSKAFILSRN